MNELFISIITHPAFNIASVLIGFLIGNYFAMGRDKRKEFVEAATEFRTFWNKFIVDMQCGILNFGDILSEEVFKTQNVSHLNFRHYLHGAYQREYNEAWNRYCDNFRHLGKVGLFTRVSRVDLIKSAENLLTFTEYKLLRHIRFIHNGLICKPHPNLSKEDMDKIQEIIKLRDNINQDKK